MSFSIRTFGDEVLRKKARPVLKITPQIEKLALEMVRLMIDADAVGLAATQIGELHRIFVMRNEVENENGEFSFLEPEIIINPQLSNPSSETEAMSEGCLSLPGITLEIQRPKSIHLRYQTLDGSFKEETLLDLRARIAMHENDHLNGVLILDRADPKDKKRALKRLKEDYLGQ